MKNLDQQCCLTISRKKEYLKETNLWGTDTKLVLHWNKYLLNIPVNINSINSVKIKSGRLKKTYEDINRRLIQNKY